MSAETTTLETLVAYHQRIDSLSDGKRWTEIAKTYMERLRGVVEQCDTGLAAIPLAVKAAAAAAKLRPFWKRLFGSAEQRSVAERARDLRASRDRAMAARDAVQSLINDTPTSEAERAAMLRELRASKKTLQLDKREINSQLQNIRGDARRQSAGAATSFLGMTTGRKYVAAERRLIRSAKEHAIASPEEAKRALDRRLLELDRQIVRIETLG